MRVAIFFDGKNFYSGWRATAEGQVVDFGKLSKWLVASVGGSWLWGAYYYTGIETGDAASTKNQRQLVDFLDKLELLPGFFVHRFSRKVRQRCCEKCGNIDTYSQEKEVDTTMVADMLRLAAVDAFDIAVLVSGDGDHTPAVEGVRAIGKQVYVATWRQGGLSPRIRKAAFDHIDLEKGLACFVAVSKLVATPTSTKLLDAVTQDVRLPDGQTEPTSVGDIEDAETAFLRGLASAEKHFNGGYVGVNYFLRTWKSTGLSKDFQARNRILQKLLQKGIIETFSAPDGKQALRSTPCQ
jgi:uncharacterized LabA/DUF88 family protein